MKIKRTKPLYLGHLVDIRDYEANQCIANGENVEIYCVPEGATMTLTPADLINKKADVSKKKYESIHGTPPYYLWMYEWEPDDE